MASPFYTPHDVLLQIHQWRRPNAADGMKLAPDVFSPDWSNGGKPYLEGVMSLASAYFVIGALIFLTYVALNLAALCCRSKPTPNKPRSALGNCCRCLFEPRLWYIVPVLALVGASAAALSRMTSFKTTINNTVNGLDSLDSVLSGAANISSGGLTAGLLGLNSSLTQLLADAQTHAPPAAPSIQSMIDATGRALVSAAGVASQLNGMVGNLDAKLHAGGKADISDLGQHVWLGGTVALALFLGFLLLSTVTLAPKRCCAVSFRLCNVLLVGAFLLVYVFAGLFMAVSLVGSDVCVDVPTALGKVANMTNANPDAVDSILYYTTCQTANGSIIPATSGAAAQLASGQATFAQTQSDFASFSTTYGMLFPAADVAAVNASLVTTGGNLTALAVQAGCVPVNTIYQTIADNLCNGGMVSIVTVWALATAACILMFLIATSAARICWRHPGDEQKQQPPAEAPRSSAAWGSAGTAVATPEAYVAMNAVGPASGTAAAYGSAAEWSATPRKF